ncbi:MAG: nitroreductase family protein [Tidjanibacter sp.]|nr:nitroreductase family protein [Tidjanibacter sp.]
MDFFELVSKRRSCRKFAEQKPERALIEKIMEATLTAPSSKNTRSTRFMVIDNPQIISRMSEMRDYGSAFMVGAPVVVLVMGTKSLTDLWEINCAISATYLQLAAEAAGLGSCWVHVGGRPRLKDEPQGEQAEEYLRTFLPIPKECGVVCAVALGYSGYDGQRTKPIANNDGMVTYL